MQEHVVMAALGDLLREAGIPPEQIWELGPEFDHAGNGNSWKTNEQDARGIGQSIKGYFWTDLAGNHQRFQGRPNAHTLHHTASKAYTPNVKNSAGQTKANGYAGMRIGGRLYSGTEGIPTIALASAGPADYSAGKNNREYLFDFVVNQLRFVGRQSKPDDDFYGNRYVWGTEVVLDGIGSPMNADLRDLILVYCMVISQHLDETPWIHHGHGQLSKRKIDLWDGAYADMSDTIFVIQTDVEALLVSPPIEPPIEPPPIEPPPVRPPMEDQGRNQLYVKEGMSGQDVEYWQVMSIMAKNSIPFSGSSNKNFILAHAPELVWKEWGPEMTIYLSEWTGRNSYGIGATERIMLETAVIGIYAAL